MLSIHVHMLVYRDEYFAITIFLAQLKISFKLIQLSPGLVITVAQFVCGKFVYVRTPFAIAYSNII